MDDPMNGENSIELQPLQPVHLPVPISYRYVYTLNCFANFPHTTEVSDAQSAFKILQINCDSFDNGLNYITSPDFQNSFYSYPYAFVIVLKCKNYREYTQNDVETLTNSFGYRLYETVRKEPKQRNERYPRERAESSGRPLIISIEFRAARTLLFFKNAFEDKFDLYPTLKSSNFQTLLTELTTEAKGFYNGKFLETLVNVSQSYDGIREIDKMLERNDLLCIRFLQLFEPDLNTANDDSIMPLEYAARHCDAHGFFAVFGLGFDLNFYEMKRNNIPKYFYEKYSRDFNLLMIASEYGNLDAIRFLLSFGYYKLEHEVDGVCAADLAWDYAQNRDDKFLPFNFLILNDSPFPRNVIAHDLPDELKTYVALVQDLRINIELSNTVKINEILERYPNHHHFYNTTNQSAAAYAIEMANDKIYKHLMDRNVYLGIREDLNELLRGQNEDFVTKITNINIAHARSGPTNHIHTLRGNAYVSHDTDDHDDKQILIKESFYYLNTINDIIPILKIVAAAKKFRIIFDFNRDNVSHIDPSSTNFTMGVFYSTHLIMIGASKLMNPLTRNEVHGVLAHELTHFAVLLTFQNSCMPFFKDFHFNAIVDEKQREDLKRVNKVRKIDFEKTLNETVRTIRKKPLKISYDPIESVACIEDSKMRKAELPARIPHTLAHLNENRADLEKLEGHYWMIFKYFREITLPKINEAIPLIEKNYEITRDLPYRYEHLTAPPKHYKSKLYTMGAILLVLAALLIGTVFTLLQCNFYSDLSKNDKDFFNSKNFTLQGEELGISKHLIRKSKLFNPLDKIPCDFANDFIEGNVKFKLGTEYWKEKIFPDLIVDKRFTHTDAKLLTLEELLKIAEKEIAINIMSGSSGSGKTLSINRMSKLIKTTYKDYWVVLIDVRNLREKDFEALKTIEQIRESELPQFLSESAFNFPNNETSFYELFFIDTKTAILVDGLGDVDEDSRNTVLMVLKRVFEDKAKMKVWITSPVGIVENVKSFLTKSKVFTMADAEKEFLATLQVPEDDKKEIDAIVKDLKENEIIGEDNMLMLKMLAIIKESKRNITNLSYTELIEEFIRFDIQKSTNYSTDVLEALIQRSIIDQLRTGFMTFFNDDQLRTNNFHIVRNPATFSITKLNNSKLIENDKFWHQTFPDYFVAYFLKDYFWIKNDTSMSKNQIQEDIKAKFDLLFYILSNYKRDFKNIKIFLNDFLDRKSTNFTIQEKELDMIFQELNETKRLEELKIANIDIHVEIYEEFFKSSLNALIYDLEYSKNTSFENLLTITKFFNQRGRIFVKILWNFYDKQTFITKLYKNIEKTEMNKLIQDIEPYFGEQDMKKLRFGIDQRGNFLFDIWYVRESKEKVDRLKETLREVEGQLNDMNRFGMLKNLSEIVVNYKDLLIDRFQSDETMKKFIKDLLNFEQIKIEENYSEDKLNKKEFFKMIDETLIEIITNLSRSSEVVKILKKLLWPEELSEIFRRTGLTMFAAKETKISSEDLKIILEFAKETDIKKFLKYSNINSFNILHSIKYFTNDGLEELFKALGKNLGKNEIRRLLIQHTPTTPLTLACAFVTDALKIEMLWNFAVKKGKSPKIYLSDKNPDTQRCALQIAMLNDNFTVFEFMVKKHDEYLPGEAANLMINGHYEKYPLIFKTFNGTNSGKINPQTPKAVWKYLMKNGNKNDIKRILSYETIFKSVNVTAKPQFCMMKKFIEKNFNEDEKREKFEWLGDCQIVGDEENIAAINHGVFLWMCVVFHVFNLILRNLI